MGNYVLRTFDRSLKGVAIDDDKLCDAARELRAGQFEANLGGHLYKKRIPLTRGKSCGVRAVMAFKSDNDLFFINGWVKNVVKKGCREIPDDVLLLYKAVAIQMINMTPEQAQLALKTGKMREVKCDG